MSKDKAAALTNEQKIKDLRAAIIEGEASGPAIAFDMNDFLASIRVDPFAILPKGLAKQMKRPTTN